MVAPPPMLAPGSTRVSTKLGGRFWISESIIRERHIWPYEDIILQRHAIPKLHARLDRDPITQDVIFDQYVRADVAVPPDAGFREDHAVLPVRACRHRCWTTGHRTAGV